MKKLKTFENFSQDTKNLGVDIYDKTRNLIQEYPQLLDEIEPGQIGIYIGYVTSMFFSSSFTDFDDNSEKIYVQYHLDKDEEDSVGFVDDLVELNDLDEDSVETIYDYLKSKM